MKLSLTLRIVLTLGVLLLAGGALVPVIHHAVGHDRAQHAGRQLRNSGASYLALILSPQSLSEREQTLRVAQPHFRVPLSIQSSADWPDPLPPFIKLGPEVGIVVVERLDADWVLVAGPSRRPPRSPRGRLIGVLVFAVALTLGAVIVARRIQSQLKELQAQIVTLGGEEYTSDAKDSSDRFEHVQRVLAWATERITRRTQERQAFLQALAHEIRTPLARIGFELDQLHRHPDRTEQMVHAVRQEIDELVELSSELSAWVEFDAETEQPQDLELVEAIRVCVELEHDRCQRDDLSLKLSLPDALHVHAQSRQLNRAIENVLRNAFFYARSALHVRLESSAGRVRLHVEDDGPGFAPDILDTALQAFVSRSRDEGTRAEGLGLGLAIAARAVRRHRGTVSLSTSRLGGACVVIELPSQTSAGPSAQQS